MQYLRLLFYSGGAKPTTGFLPELPFSNYLKAIDPNNYRDIANLKNYMDKHSGRTQIINSMKNAASKLGLDPIILDLIHSYQQNHPIHT